MTHWKHILTNSLPWPVAEHHPNTHSTQLLGWTLCREQCFAALSATTFQFNNFATKTVTGEEWNIVFFRNFNIFAAAVHEVHSIFKVSNISFKFETAFSLNFGGFWCIPLSKRCIFSFSGCCLHQIWDQNLFVQKKQKKWKKVLTKRRKKAAKFSKVTI